MSRLSRFIRYFAAAASLFAAASLGAGPAKLGPNGAAIADAGGGVVVTVPLSHAVPWSVRIADGPPRLVVEFHDADIARPPRLGSGSFAAVETRRSGPGSSQIVALLREPLVISSAEMVTAGDGSARLTVLLTATTAGVFTEAAEREAPHISGGRMVVALDPGHGGFDPGARTAGHEEADLVLTFAERLRDELHATGRFDVVLTREDDSFVSLDDRISRARAAGAEVFLSLHADALEDAGAASGLVVYSMSEAARRQAALRLAERHEGTDLLTGVDLTGAGDDVTLALLDLARTETEPRARALSATLVAAFGGAGLAVNSMPERRGDFAVLKSADFPSLLIELGFLSTEADLRRMTSETWQDQAAGAIRDALLLWSDEDRLR